MQDGHPVAYESRKLNDRERNYSAHEKEMTAIVHYLRTWRLYLLGVSFIVKTDNVSSTYFKTQSKLTLKQARWQEFLAEFDFELVYNPGQHNVVANALSRKEQLSALELLGQSQVVLNEDMIKKIKEGLENDSQAWQIILQVRAGRTQKFTIQVGFCILPPTEFTFRSGEKFTRRFCRSVMTPFGQDIRDRSE